MSSIRFIRMVLTATLFGFSFNAHSQGGVVQKMALNGGWADLELKHVNYAEKATPDQSLLRQLPPELQSLLKQVNGFVQFDGGLHVRGATDEPKWHSLKSAWVGKNSLSQLYPTIQKTDIPFGEDCVGDQFFLRTNVVFKLLAETGDVQNLNISLKQFLLQAQAAPIKTLELAPLIQFRDDGGNLKLGQVIHVYPPFATKEAKNGVAMKAVPADEALQFHAEFAKKISALPDGAKFKVEIVK